MAVDILSTPDIGAAGVTLNWATEPNPIHTNVITVRRTQPDVFAIVFGDVMNMPGRLAVNEVDGKKVVVAPVVASLRVPLSSMAAFVGAMTESWNEYVRSLPPSVQREALPVFERTSVTKKAIIDAV